MTNSNVLPPPPLLDPILVNNVMSTSWQQWFAMMFARTGGGYSFSNQDLAVLNSLQGDIAEENQDLQVFTQTISEMLPANLQNLDVKLSAIDDGRSNNAVNSRFYTNFLFMRQ